jgi:hypothetical protein
MDKIATQILDPIVILIQQHIVQLLKDFMPQVEPIALVPMDEDATMIMDKYVTQLTIMLGVTFLTIHKAAFLKMVKNALI